MRARVLLAALGCAALAACNGVVSTTPLFSESDAQGQPQLRPGVWVNDHKDCAFDERAPIDQWPGCLDHFVVRPGAIVSSHSPDTPPSSWTVNPIVLARGDPAIVQVTMDDKSGPPPSYDYLGLRPLKLDAQGRVIAFKTWPALCGPPPPGDDGGDPTLTRHPIDGATPRPATHDCLVTAQGPVRASARLSEAWDDDTEGRDHAHWVRDGEK